MKDVHCSAEVLQDYCKFMRSSESEWDNGQPDGPERFHTECIETVLFERQTAINLALSLASLAEDVYNGNELPDALEWKVHEIRMTLDHEVYRED